MTHAPIIFDHQLLKAHQQRAMAMLENDSLFLWNELVGRLIDRLDDMKRTFPRVLEIGSLHGELKERLAEKYGIEKHVQLEHFHSELGQPTLVGCLEELAVKPYSMDLVISLANLQWANNLPFCLTQILHTLKPDGLFIALIPGENTLMELRQSLDAAMLDCYGGISPRVSPMLTMHDASALIQRTGFALPVIDRESIQISYSTPLKLMHDLRAMGQTNALKERSNVPLTKTMLDKTCKHYESHFQHPEGGVCATIDIMTLIGWAPEKSQPKPLARGSAKLSMKDILS